MIRPAKTPQELRDTIHMHYKAINALEKLQGTMDALTMSRSIKTIAQLRERIAEAQEELRE